MMLRRLILLVPLSVAIPPSGEANDRRSAGYVAYERANSLFTLGEFQESGRRQTLQNVQADRIVEVDEARSE